MFAFTDYNYLVLYNLLLCYIHIIFFKKVAQNKSRSKITRSILPDLLNFTLTFTFIKLLLKKR